MSEHDFSQISITRDRRLVGSLNETHLYERARCATPTSSASRSRSIMQPAFPVRRHLHARRSAVDDDHAARTRPCWCATSRPTRRSSSRGRTSFACCDVPVTTTTARVLGWLSFGVAVYDVALLHRYYFSTALPRFRIETMLMWFLGLGVAAALLRRNGVAAVAHGFSAQSSRTDRPPRSAAFERWQYARAGCDLCDRRVHPLRPRAPRRIAVG